MTTQTPRLITRKGFLWHVEFNDNDFSPGTMCLVRGWTFASAYQAARRQSVDLGVLRMERVTPLTVRFWEFAR